MAAATIKSTLFHPEHPLKIYHYGEGSTYSCAACELRVTGTGYRCHGCNFNIHQACLSLPVSISVACHPGHELDLYRLNAGFSRRCDVCGVTSHAGAYMYICAACNYDVHPRCQSLAGAAQPPQAHGGRRHRGRALQCAKIALRVGIFGLKVADIFTNGLMSPALDAFETMVDHI
ncbi:unnamed protein product [Urochloa decumbens]|uniref:Phorbol-ester/DAG-type domain-containing protein n=1 Tax=Urochloa decumbens TaxID=240449 RepID=A0ABC9G1C6_9POAL